MNIEEIKEQLNIYNNRHPQEPPQNKIEEILHDTVRMKAKMFEDNAVESVRYLLSIVEQAEKALEKILIVDLDYSFEDVDQMKIIAEETLQAIRGE